MKSLGENGSFYQIIAQKAHSLKLFLSFGGEFLMPLGFTTFTHFPQINMLDITVRAYSQKFQKDVTLKIEIV